MKEAPQKRQKKNLPQNTILFFFFYVTWTFNLTNPEQEPVVVRGIPPLSFCVSFCWKDPQKKKKGKKFPCPFCVLVCVCVCVCGR